MKAKSFLLPLLVLSLLIFSAVSTRSQTVITFEDAPNSSRGVNLPDGYQGLSWSNFGVVNAVLTSNLVGVSGANYGMVSPSNVAYSSAFGLPSEIDSPGTNFSFLSVYLTGAWNSNVNIDVQGFRSGALAYDLTAIAEATNSTLFTFNYLDIDRLNFTSFGGQDAGFRGGRFAAQFIMDNFTLQFVPEPSTILLAILGALLLWPLLKRKRA
jgi:hypothetical protein